VVNLALATSGKGTAVTEGKSVVVGVDGSRSSRVALAWAADQAALLQAELVAVAAWEPSILPPAGNPSVPETDASNSSQRAREELLSVITQELGEDPPVPVQPVVKRGHAAEVLIELSANADLLVVGTRGHGGFAGLVLGSVSQHVAAYARCPVTVVR
jgi:nucleotide-binding universal stress UspA family protein